MHLCFVRKTSIVNCKIHK
jgi:Peptidase propeptide and YPEB domain